MKYGILTYHNIPNVGAILQAQALCDFIRRSGFDCEIIDYSCDNIVDRELTFHPSPNLLKNLLIKYYWKKTKKKIAKCKEYVNSLHQLSSESYNRNSIVKSNDVYDAFISGSDMIWNLDINGEDYAFFLDFTSQDKKRLSFASSIGRTWTVNEREKVLPLLKRYHSVSVREEDTNIVLNEMGISSSHLADPTLLLDADEWGKYAQSIDLKNYVLIYFPNRELIKKAKEYAKNHSLKLVVISQGVPTLGVTKVWPNNPPGWLGLFLNANAVFTNSFHGLLFSFYFKKQVWTANYGNRIISILESLNQTNCRLDIDTDLHYKIDYEVCCRRLSELRKKSQDYIITTLTQIECKE